MEVVKLKENSLSTPEERLHAHAEIVDFARNLMVHEVNDIAWLKLRESNHDCSAKRLFDTQFSIFHLVAIVDCVDLVFVDLIHGVIGQTQEVQDFLVTQTAMSGVERDVQSNFKREPKMNTQNVRSRNLKANSKYYRLLKWKTTRPIPILTSLFCFLLNSRSKTVRKNGLYITSKTLSTAFWRKLINSNWLF